MTDQETLKLRREKNFDTFAQRTARNPRYAHWFPRARDTGHGTRAVRLYDEENARTEHYKNSPVFLMRRRLNELNIS